MSLADLQWCPTSVQVTVLQARGLRVKGKGGTNDAYAVMHLGKEKYQTSVVEKSVAPVWREEAAFDLPPLLLLHQGAGGGGGGGGAGERGTLRVHVLHRALVGPDKQLGQAVINLLQLSDDKTRSKTEWFKLLDKTGKADKDRGEVLVDIQFMRNNMTASMFDLSAAGKSRSRLGKFKDKVRGKKKDSDTASGLVPSFSQVLTDSEGEAICDEEAAVGKDGKKKKHKMKSLFSSKSNLQKNMSQSMSVLPVKNSSLSSSQSSGLNMDFSEGKKKFKFKIPKRSGSSDGKDSSSSQQKQGATEQSNLCINGSHVYREERQNRTSHIGSNFSLNSSGRGSMEDVPESSPPSVESLQAVRQYSAWTEEEEEEEEEEKAEVEHLTEDMEEHRKDEEEVTRMEEERRRRIEEEDERKQEEAVERLAEQKRRQDEEERKRIEEEKVRREEEERLRKQEEALERLAEEKRQEEEERKRIEEEKVRREEEERLRKQGEALERLAEEKRRQEEERKRIEEEEKVRREEEQMILRKRQEEEEEEQVRREEQQQRERLEEEKKRREEQERKRVEGERIRMEEERVQEDRMREEERIREEECSLAQDKRRMEEERMIEEEQMRRREVEECDAKRKLEDQEKKQQEEEERARKEKERLAEERRKLEQKERERMEDEERLKREKDERMRMEEEKRREEEEAEKVRREVEEKRRLEEQERRIIEEVEKRQREEAERILEDDRARKEKEEYEKLVEEKRKLEEQERRQKEEKERIRHEEEERTRIEEERRRREEDEDRAIKEEMERLAEEKKRLEEQEKRRIEEEGEILREEEERKRRLEEAAREKREEEARKLEMEKLKDAEAQKKKENTTKDGHKASGKKPRVAEESPAGVTCSNPFEDVPESPAAPDSSTSHGLKVKQGYPSAVSSVGSETRSTDQRDLIGAQRDKRPAPQPPRGNVAESQREQDVLKPHQAQTNKQSNDRDVKTASVLPQRSVQVIAPLSQPRANMKSPQSSMQGSDAKGAGGLAKPSKRPAPSRPPAEEELSSKPKSLSVSEVGGPETKQAPVVYSSNPFEDDEDEPTAQEDSPTPGSVHWPPAASQDAASQAKLKSSKMARAPPPPPTSSTLAQQNDDGGHVTAATGVAAPDKAAKQTRAPQPEVTISAAVQDTSLKEPQPARAQSTAEVTGVKKEGPPTTSRRLQPVKPLNPQEQKPAPVVQSEKNNNSPEIEKKREVQDKTKILSQVNDGGPKGPYTQLTQRELISLVLKQEKQLAEKDKKIAELELYIDNLLVRVIEESPGILMSLNSLKRTV